VKKKRDRGKWGRDREELTKKKGGEDRVSVIRKSSRKRRRGRPTDRHTTGVGKGRGDRGGKD